eukprot:1812207-Rhodomonas_salina.1
MLPSQSPHSHPHPQRLRHGPTLTAYDGRRDKVSEADTVYLARPLIDFASNTTAAGHVYVHCPQIFAREVLPVRIKKITTENSSVRRTASRQGRLGEDLGDGGCAIRDEKMSAKGDQCRVHLHVREDTLLPPLPQDVVPES